MNFSFAAACSQRSLYTLSHKNVLLDIRS